MLINKPLILSTGIGVAPVHTIDQSIRFNDDDSAYLKKDYGSDGSQTTFTLSGWLKLGILTGTAHSLFATGFLNGSAADFTLYFTGDQLYFFGGYNGGTSTNRLETTQLFRDHSSWYHIVFVADTTNAVSSERLRLYVNGSRVTAFDTETYPSQNDTLVWGDATYSHVIGASGDDMAGSLNSQTPRYHYDGYMAEIVYIDGTALDPSSFGEYNSSNIWIPKDVSSLSFGANGFYLKGESASDLGNDSSGNNNDFTTSGLAAHDQVSDSPTNNFCVLSRINMGSATGVTLRDGNLDGRTSGTAGNAPASISLDSGKWYYELNVHAAGSGLNAGAGETPTGSFHHFTLGSNGNQINANGEDRAFSSGNIVGFKLDIDGGTLEYTTDGSSYSTVEGSLTANTAYAPYMRLGASSGRGVFNFGQDSTFGGLETSGSAGASDDNGIGDFYYSVPSGFLAICTKNLGS
jgi:hypothetical protein